MPLFHVRQVSRIGSVARAGAVVGAASAASRLLGFARDVLIAGVLGAGAVADAFLVAFRIPNVIRRVLGEGGLNAGFVPLHGDIAATGGREAARLFAGRTIANAALFFAALTGLAQLAAGGLVLALAAGFGDADKFALAVWYTRLALPFVAFTGLAALLAALLNAHRRFTAAAVAPALVNGVLIGALLLLDGATENDIATGAWLAVAISLSGLLHLVIVAWAVARMPERPPLSRPRFDADTKRLVRFAVPALVASGMTQIILLAAMALASGQPSTVSWLYYADRVFQLPLSFIAVAAGVVLLPEFVARAGRDNGSASSAALTRYLTGALALALPATAGLIALGHTIVSVLFERGAFEAADSRATAALLMALAIGLPAAGASKVLSQPFFARRQVWPPIAAGLAGVAATLAGGHALAETWGSMVAWPSPFSDAPVPFGSVGLAASLGLWVQALVLAALARADIVWSRHTGGGVARLALAATLMGLVAAAADGVTAQWLAPGQPLALRGAVLAALCAAGVLVYLLTMRMLGLRDALAPEQAS